MSIPQVGQGAVAVVPTFVGFRKRTDAEFAMSAKSGTSIFNSGFRSAGLSAGKGFASSFDSATKGITSATLKQVQSEVAKASREVSALRLREQDATGRVRVAEATLAEARRRYASDSSQVIRAEERLASVQRGSITAKENLLGATNRLAAAQRNLAEATNVLNSAGGRAGGTFANLSNVFGNAGRDGGSRFSQGFKDVLGGVLGANLLTGIGYTIGRSIGEGARAGIGFGLDAVKLASDLEQSTGAVTAQFKDQADAIFNAARTAATSVGLSRSTFQQYSTVVGAQLKNLGLRQDQVSGKTIELITLGADLAAQFGGPTSQAVEALSSLLRGERDPIERYGVSLKQADIDARVAAMGLGELTGEAEKQAQIQATLALLWEQTADAQGTFFREQDTYAGKQQRLMAQLQDAQTEFGEALLPTAIDVLEFANDDLLPILKSTLATAGPQISESLRSAMPEIEATLRALGENLPELINLGGSVSGIVATSIEGDFGEGGIIGGLPRVQSELDAFFNDYLPKWSQGAVSAEESWDGFFQWWDYAWDGAAGTAHNKSNEIKDYWRSGALSALQELEAMTPAWVKTGEHWGDGLAQGIAFKRATVREQAALLAGDAVFTSRNVMGIESPSKIAKQIGDYWGQGLVLGMRGQAANVRRAAEDLALVPSQAAVAAAGVSTAPGLGGPYVPVTVYAGEEDGRVLGRKVGIEIANQLAGG